jgi:DNA-binding NarL/FixJ family response regulator
MVARNGSNGAKVPSTGGVDQSMRGLAAPSADMSGQRLSVAVCVEERSHRDRVCAALVAGGHAVFACDPTVEALLDSCKSGTPACVVVAADRPDRSAMRAVRLIRSKLDGASAVLICRRARGTEVRRAVELGVDGVVLNDDGEEVLVAVVAAVCAGQVSVPGGHRGEVVVQPLTTRERQTLALVVTGLTNAEIAEELFLAESTVKSHLSSAFGKLGVSSRYEAATVILDPEHGRPLGIRELRSVAPRFSPEESTPNRILPDQRSLVDPR